MNQPRSSLVDALLLAGACCCACGASGGAPAVVSAPSSPAPRAAASALQIQPESSPGPDTPVACGKPWNLGVIGGEGRVVVVCPHDVRRQALEESGAIARALSPALDPARDRVCACVARLRAPAFVDLVFTANPEEGQVTVEAGGDDDLDPDLGPPFVACVGKITARFEPARSDVCSGPGKVAFIYPVRLDLAP